MRIVAMTVGLLLVVSGASAQTADASMSGRLAEFNAAIKGKNAAKVAAFFTEDAVSYGEQSRPVKGRAALQRLWEKALNEGSVLTMIDKAVDAQVSGTLGYIYGTFAYPSSNGTPGRTGNFLQVWKKVGNQWLIAYDTFSDDPPSPGPK
jgi:ketosteroid isomerase-like protein